MVDIRLLADFVVVTRLSGRTRTVRAIIDLQHVSTYSLNGITFGMGVIGQAGTRAQVSVSLYCNVSREEHMIELGVWLVMPVAFWGLADETSALGLLDSWRWMNSLSRGVIIVLAVMLVRTLSLSGDCLVRFCRARRQSRLFVSKSNEVPLRDPKQIIALARSHPESHIAKIVASGLTGVSRLFQWSSRDVAIEGGQRRMKRATYTTQAELQYGLATLATIASSAPFIGLLGTVAGLLNALGPGSMQVGAYRAFVAEALSEALLTAAMGLLVAVPAVWSYNFFRDWLSVLMMEMENTSSELVGYLLSQREWRIGVVGVESEAAILSLAADRNGIQKWEVPADSHTMFLLLLWLSWLYFMYALARGLYWSMSWH